MALTASLDLVKSPIELTVVSDRRLVRVTVAAVGESTVATGRFPITLTDSTGRTWTLKPGSEVEGTGAQATTTTAVYTSP